MDQRMLARAALLLALTIVLQSLRLIVPLPPFFTTFVIGSFVNACLLIAVETAGLGAALVIAAVAPIVAYLQQLLPLPVFILPVAAGNVVYVLLFRLGRGWSRAGAIGLSAVGKTALLYFSFVWLLTLINLPPRLAQGLLFVMSWPQLVTTLLGGVLATVVVRRLNRS